jgi:hypothetical protein
MKTWTKIEDYNTAAIDADARDCALPDERDCVYPLCLIEVEGYQGCEHACPFEKRHTRLK